MYNAFAELFFTLYMCVNVDDIWPPKKHAQNKN